MLNLSRKIGQKIFVYGPKNEIITITLHAKFGPNAELLVKSNLEKLTHQPMLLVGGTPFIICDGRVKIYNCRSNSAETGIGIDAGPEYQIKREELVGKPNLGEKVENGKGLSPSNQENSKEGI